MLGDNNDQGEEGTTKDLPNMEKRQKQEGQDQKYNIYCIEVNVLE